MSEDSVAKLVTTKPEAEIAADIKRRLEEAFLPVLELIDEANRAGLWVRFDAIGAQPPTMKNKIVGLRLERHY